LGVPGLIAAYGGSAEEAVKNAIITKHVIRETLELTFEYPHISFVERVIKFHDIDVIKREQKENVNYHLLVRRSKLKKVIEHVQENYHVTIRSV
jgi:putative IMPACT (imprinted ancient) family translation regulator